MVTIIFRLSTKFQKNCKHISWIKYLNVHFGAKISRFWHIVHHLDPWKGKNEKNILYIFLKLDGNYFFPTFYQISVKFQAYFLDKVPKCPLWG